MNKFNWWIIPITFFIIGYFGFFWTMNLADAKLSIELDSNFINVTENMNKMLEEQNHRELRQCAEGCMFVAKDYLGNGSFIPEREVNLINECFQFCSVTKQ